MSLTTEIYNAFSIRAGAFAAAQGLPIAYPDISFTPPPIGQWLEVRAFWNDGANYGMADDGPTVEQGFFRLMACGRTGSGLMDLQTLAESIVAAFPKGTMLAKARVERSPSMSGPIQDDDRSTIPVTIRWRATR